MSSRLVIHAGALGDSVILWPLLRHLGAGADGVGFVTHRGKARLAARYVPGIDPIDGDDPAWSRLFGDDPDAIDDDVRRCLTAPRRILSFVSAGNDAWARNVRHIAPQAELIPLLFRPPADQPMPPARWHRHQLGLDDHLEAPRRINSQGPLVVHPGAGSPAKCWPVDRFVEVAKLAADARREVRFVLGEVELERWPGNAVDALRSAAPVLTPTDYVDLGAMLEPAWAFLGNDSGPAHLAAAIGLPTVTLFGPTDPRVWNPPGAIALQDMNTVSPGDVLAALHRAASDSS